MLTKKIFLGTMVAALAFLSGCGEKYEGYQKADSGLFYRFEKQSTIGEQPNNDDLVWIKMSIRNANDSVIYPDSSIIVQMQPPKFQGDILDAIRLMRQGDSATFIINANNYFRTYEGSIPPFVKNDKEKVYVSIKVDSIQSYKMYQENKVKQQRAAEQAVFVTYMTENNLPQTEPTQSGLYYIETKAGKGNTPQNGQTCMVHYTGRFLDGRVFDSSVERGAPFAFALGQNQVIKGWDEGVALMKKGGKAVLLIPANLAYGEHGSGSIPPNTPLMFEVELIDIQ